MLMSSVMVLVHGVVFPNRGRRGFESLPKRGLRTCLHSSVDRANGFYPFGRGFESLWGCRWNDQCYTISSGEWRDKLDTFR